MLASRARALKPKSCLFQGCCEHCGRPHGQVVRHVGDGRWWDEARQTWRDGWGRKVPCPAPAEQRRAAPRRWCWWRRISTMTRRIAAGGAATFGRCASGVTCCTTGRSTGGGSGSPAAAPGAWRPVRRALPNRITVQATYRLGHRFDRHGHHLPIAEAASPSTRKPPNGPLIALVAFPYAATS